MNLEVKNMTDLFSRELVIYGFKELKLKKPILISMIFYLFFFAIILVPIGWKIAGFGFYGVGIPIAISWGLANLLTKPIWNKRKFLSYLIIQIKYFFNPRTFYDGKAGKPEFPIYHIDESYTVSRRKDFKTLFALRQIEAREKEEELTLE